MICDNIFKMSVKKYLEKLEDLSGKEVLITGGTSGIGLSIVKHLLAKHATVIVLARNMRKADEVKTNLLLTYPEAQLSFIKYDQSDDESIKNAAQEIITNHKEFYALILNAGIIQRKKPTKFVDGYPLTIKTNYVGLASFLNYLLPNLNGHHRFIFQGSLAAGFHLKNIESLKDKNISLWQQYFISKAGVEALFYHYSLSELPFDFILVEPGIAITGIVRDFSSIIKFLARIFSRIVSHGADKAALTAMLAIQSTTKNNSYIVPRGLFTWRGYPKFKSFPKKREKNNLFEMLNEQ